MTTLDTYDADVDEMTAGGLAVLKEIRDRLAVHFAGDAKLTAAITGLVDGYAAELVDDVIGEDDE